MRPTRDAMRMGELGVGAGLTLGVGGTGRSRLGAGPARAGARECAWGRDGSLTAERAIAGTEQPRRGAPGEGAARQRQLHVMTSILPRPRRPPMERAFVWGAPVDRRRRRRCRCCRRAPSTSARGPLWAPTCSGRAEVPARTEAVGRGTPPGWRGEEDGPGHRLAGSPRPKIWAQSRDQEAARARVVAAAVVRRRRPHTRVPPRVLSVACSGSARAIFVSRKLLTGVLSTVRLTTSGFARWHHTSASLRSCCSSARCATKCSATFDISAAWGPSFITEQ